MPLNNEIERKWLISPDDIPFDLTKARCENMVQSYISFSPTIRLRCINNAKHILCVKAKAKGSYLAREEFETELTREQYDELIKKIEGNIIEKTRYTVKYEGLSYEIDIFRGSLAPLAYLEIEFPSVEAAMNFKSPDWIIKDVTDNFRYKNAGLAKMGKPAD